MVSYTLGRGRRAGRGGGAGGSGGGVRGHRARRRRLGRLAWRVEAPGGMKVEVFVAIVCVAIGCSDVSLTTLTSSATGGSGPLEN